MDIAVGPPYEMVVSLGVCLSHFDVEHVKGSNVSQGWTKDGRLVPLGSPRDRLGSLGGTRAQKSWQLWHLAGA